MKCAMPPVIRNAAPGKDQNIIRQRYVCITMGFLNKKFLYAGQIFYQFDQFFE
jgi:hypothetical protein